MTTTLELNDASVWTGIPFVIRVSAPGEEAPASVEVRAENVQGIVPFVVPVRKFGADMGTAELSLSLPGRYVASASGTQIVFEVRERRDLGFGTEFGVFFVLVAFALWRVFQWHRNRKST